VTAIEKPYFASLQRRTLSTEIREKIKVAIESGELARGSQLPSERDLSEQFGVARTSVREAIQGLIAIGLVERIGNRTFVCGRLASLGMESPDLRKVHFHDLFEVRRTIEPPIGSFAATRATAEKRRELLELSAQFRQELTIEEFRDLDCRFHSLLASLCGNTLLVELYGSVLEALFRTDEFTDLLTASENRPAVGRLIRLSGRDHRKIARAVQSGDASEAANAIRQHLDNVERRVLSQLV
jgi:GntR family transcriptional repressor for pyruvate dehydrogenase complex